MKFNKIIIWLVKNYKNIQKYMKNEYDLLDSDYVQTPFWCAKDMADFYKPEAEDILPDEIFLQIKERARKITEGEA